MSEKSRGREVSTEGEPTPIISRLLQYLALPVTNKIGDCHAAVAKQQGERHLSQNTD